MVGWLDESVWWGLHRWMVGGVCGQEWSNGIVNVSLCGSVCVSMYVCVCVWGGGGVGGEGRGLLILTPTLSASFSRFSSKPF